MKALSIIPCIQYKNAVTAIEWLCGAFGFEKHLIVPGENEKIIHAELTIGQVMIMVGSSGSDTEFSRLVKHPLEIGGFETQSPYIVLQDEDINDHYEIAIAAGAKIILELKSQDYGGKTYSCCDPEGHLWNFGSYNPLAQCATLAQI